MGDVPTALVVATLVSAGHLPPGCSFNSHQFPDEFLTKKTETTAKPYIGSSPSKASGAAAGNKATKALAPPIRKITYTDAVPRPGISRFADLFKDPEDAEVAL